MSSPARQQRPPRGDTWFRDELNESGVNLMTTKRISDAEDLSLELSAEARELLQEPTVCAAAQQFFAFLEKAHQIRTASDLARVEEEMADLVARLGQAAVIARLPQITGQLPPEERPAMEQRLRNLSLNPLHRRQ